MKKFLISLKSDSGVNVLTASVLTEAGTEPREYHLTTAAMKSRINWAMAGTKLARVRAIEGDLPISLGTGVNPPREFWNAIIE